MEKTRNKTIIPFKPLDVKEVKYEKVYYATFRIVRFNPILNYLRRI